MLQSKLSCVCWRVYLLCTWVLLIGNRVNDVTDVHRWSLPRGKKWLLFFVADDPCHHKDLSPFQQEWWCNMLQIPAHQLLLHGNKYILKSGDCCSQWTAHVPNSSTALRCAEDQRKHNCVLDVLTLAAWWLLNNMVIKRHLLRIPDHHCFICWCRRCNWCALEPQQQMCSVSVQRSDVHNTNASTTEYAHQTSLVDGEIRCRSKLTNHSFICLDTQALWPFWTESKYSAQLCRTSMQAQLGDTVAYGDWLHLMIQTLWLMCTGTTAKYVPSSSTVLRCAKNQCKHKWVCSQEANYLGLDYPCPDIEEFFNSISDDQHMVEFVRRLLGYGITGHTRPETQASQGEQWRGFPRRANRGKVSASRKSVRMYTKTLSLWILMMSDWR